MASSVLVAAIDFGTTYSGWAFSFTHDYQRDPTLISAKNWSSGKFLSQKAPTAVLIKPNGKTFEAFGFEAEDKYVELAEEGEHKKWYYFRRFKMLLMDKIDLKRNVTIEDESGKELPAKTVFSMAIKYLKDDLLKEGSTRVAGGIRPDDIMWVLTVPAIWNDSAKQFMREAAYEAGIKNNKLKIALEPETASMFCRLLPVEKMIGGFSTASMQEGCKYMVLDAGGGTVDITLHKILGGGKLQEVHKASGGAWGGTKVDEAYRQFVISIVGNLVFQKFVNDHMEDYIDMTREFEIKKRDIELSKDSRITIRFPFSLTKIFEEETGESLKEAIRQTNVAGDVTVLNDKIRVEARVMRRFFDESLGSISDHVKKLFAMPAVKDISGILMVGGFSESKMLQETISRIFPDKIIVVPQEAGLVVLKGAVVFGHCSGMITDRIAKYTYGVKATRAFIKGKHDESKKYIDPFGEEKCHGLFSKLVEIGQTLHLNSFIERSYGVHPKLDKITVGIYASTQKEPMYVTDDECFLLGYMNLDVDKSIQDHKKEFHFGLSFGDTEINVRAIEESTGRETTCTVDFLD